jgi:uncharacterized protein
MEELVIQGQRLLLLPQKAIYAASLEALLVSDVHLGKAETFQHYGIPIPSQVNHSTLERLGDLCAQHQPRDLWILGDLFHSVDGLTDEVIDLWLQFLASTQVRAYLILGNHDRRLQATLSQLSIECFVEAVEVDGLLLSHEPSPDPTNPDRANLCGHIHPCLRLNQGCDRLRLPCFHWQGHHQRLTLPAFGEFTGGHDIALAPGDVAYVVAEDTVVAFAGP